MSLARPRFLYNNTLYNMTDPNETAKPVASRAKISLLEWRILGVKWKVFIYSLAVRPYFYYSVGDRYKESYCILEGYMSLHYS
jgi:hypothetical protein